MPPSYLDIAISLPDETIVLDERFLSFSLDTSLIVGGAWWSNDGSRNLSDGPLIDLRNPDLNYYTSQLAPAYLRIGGTEADRVYLANGNEAIPDEYISVLRPERLSSLLNFIQTNQLDWMLTLNYGPANHADGRWQTEQLQRWLAQIEVNQAALPVFELGNEIGGHWLFFGLTEQKFMSRYRQDFALAQQELHNIAPLAGPANAYWPWIGEAGASIFGHSNQLLANQPDIFSWHFYPTQSPRCSIASNTAYEHSLLDATSLTAAAEIAHSLQHEQKQRSPNTKLWLGETGPAQCGGVKDLTDTFSSSIWWLSHLGVMASAGQQVVVRQSLYGANYGLLDESFKPNPDYWASWLWKQQMGTKVLWVDHALKGGMRRFAHCHASKEKTISLLLINANESEKTLRLPVAQSRYLQATSPALRSKLVLVNEVLIDTLGFELVNFPWQKHSSDSINLAAHSWTFIELDDAKGLCQ